MRKWPIVSLILLAVSSLSVAAAKQDVFIYGESNYPPYTWIDNGEFRGIYVDIFNKAFEKMEDYNIQLKAVPWERGLFLLEQGEAFALFPPYYYSQRRPFISPYSVPILMEKTVLVCRKGIFSKGRTRWPEDFMGLTIGINSGYLVGGDKFLDAVQQGKIFVSESLEAERHLLMLAAGRTDCYVNDELSIKLEIQRLKKDISYNNQLDNIDIGPTISYEYSYLGFTNVNEHLYPYKNDFVLQFNRVINEMKQSGEIDFIVNKYIENESN